MIEVEGIGRKGRGRLVHKVSAGLTNWCDTRGAAVRRCARTSLRAFPRQTVEDWLRAGGRTFIALEAGKARSNSTRCSRSCRTREATMLDERPAMTIQLPEPVRFQDIDLTIIDRNGVPWLTRLQIATALDVKNRQAITHIYTRNKDEFTEGMTAVIRQGRTRVRIFSPRGCHLIAMFARTERAKAFRRCVLDVLEGLARPGVAVRAHTRRKPAPPRRSIEDRFKASHRDGRYLVMARNGHVAEVMGLRDHNLVNGHHIPIVRRNLQMLCRQMAILSGDIDADILKWPLAPLVVWRERKSPKGESRDATISRKSNNCGRVPNVGVKPLEGASPPA